MYLISLYLDNDADENISRFIKKVASATGNTFMTDNNVPPHITIAAFEARNDKIAARVFEKVYANILTRLDVLSNREKDCTDITYVSVGMFLPYVLYITPVLNEYLHTICASIYDVISHEEGILPNKYYEPFSYLPHTTIGKKLSEEEMKMAIDIMRNSFVPFLAKIKRIGLAKPNPHRDIVMYDI